MRTHVVAAVLEDIHERILITKRPEHVHQGGLWEFPGGKLDPGESPDEALARELREELGVIPRAYRPLIRIAHDYADKQVLLDVYRVLNYAGKPQGREGQPLAWVSRDNLVDYAMPAADRPIVAATLLPDRYVFTPPSAADPESFLRSMALVLKQGARLVQLRVFGLPHDEYLQLARRAVDLCHERDARLLINSEVALAQQAGADGVHFSASRLATLNQRPERFSWISASCHNAVELRRALELDLDFAVLSPVLPTPSHPDAQPLGWERFTALVGDASIPVFALGGMDPSMLEMAWQAGAQGIAGIRGFWPIENL